MPYTNVVHERFPGLRLLPEQAEAAGSVAMLNADIAKDLTQVGSRGGLSRLVTGTATYHRIAPYMRTDDATTDVVATPYLVLLRNTGTQLDMSYTPIASPTVTNIALWGGATTRATSHAMFGDPPGTSNDTFLLVASRTGTRNEDIRMFFYANATNSFLALDSVLGVDGRPRYVAITPWDNRIAQAHYGRGADSPTGADGSASTVFFSGVGPANTWAADDFVTLGANDGDEITGMVAWRELLLVLKERTLYVFHAPSVDSTGNPVFNYRRVELPARARKTASRGGENMIAGGDGVYLLLADGVYRTLGDVPQLVSREITPIFDGTGDSSMLFPSSSSADWTIGYATNRVLLSYAVGATFRTLVYDTVLREWLLWDLNAGQAALPTNVVEWVDTNGLPTGYLASGGRVFSFTKTGTSDDGAAIVSHYQSGFLTLADGKDAHVRDFDLWGTGTVTHQIATDYGAVDSGASVTLGTAPTPALGFDTLDRMGRNMSFKVGASSGGWTLTRWMARIKGVRDWT